MPRFSVSLKDENGRVIGIGCGSYRRKRCSYCADLGAQLECDGCDKPLCRTCAVSPRDGVDMCPRCFEPAWRHWLKLQPSSAGAMTQQARRLAFRRWARAAAEKFLELAPLGAVAKAMTVDRGHLVAKEKS